MISKPHVIFLIANNSRVPYFNWFAEQNFLLSKVKLSFICLCPEPPGMVEDMRKYGYECHWIKYDDRSRKSGLLLASFKLYRLFKKLKPDVINSHLFDDSLAALFAGKLAGIKKRIITKNDATFHYFYTPRWVIFDKLNNLLATHIVPISEESRRFIVDKEKADPAKIHLIHHGLSVPKSTLQINSVRSEFIQRWGLENKIVIGTISRFIEWKGYKSIIRTAEKLVRKYPEMVFLLTGRGEQITEIMQLVDEKRLNKHVIFTGWIPPENIPSLFGIYSIYLHAAHYEPFGFVIAEAMFNQIPVVSTNTGAAADGIVHLKSGYLCSYE
jgi:glycosyltransferase involved in cell wall biosynthesis